MSDAEDAVDVAAVAAVTAEDHKDEAEDGVLDHNRGGEEEEVKEISTEEMLENMLTDETFMDVALQGTDGVEVHANRTILAGRSVVFRKMLLGDFSEAKAEVVPLRYHSSVLKALVQYIHTNTVDIKGTFEILDEIETLADERPLDFDDVQNQVSLMGAATYFFFPVLHKKVESYLVEKLDTISLWPWMSCAVLEACRQEGPPGSSLKRLEDYGWERLRFFASKILSTEGMVEILSPSLVEDIVKNTELVVFENELFWFLHKWAKGGEPNDARTEIAAELTKHIDFSKIGPVYLSSVVAPSGLASPDQLSEAFKSHAIYGQTTGAIGFESKMRKLPEWDETRTLKMDSVKTGIHQWTIEVDDRDGCASSVHLGIYVTGLFRFCMIKCEFDEAEVFEQDYSGAVVLPCDCSARRLLRFGHGSKVTFVLNFVEDENGMLSASVDGKNLVPIFTNLTGGLPEEKSKGKGCLPAMRCDKDARVNLLSLEKVYTS